MRALLPRPSDRSGPDSPEVDLHEVYAAGWMDRIGVRANFISSVDGAVSAAGVSRGLQTPGDNRIFAALRDLADVVLVGAGTARAEEYAAIHLSDGRRQNRRRYGLAPVLPTALVTRSLRVDPRSDLFAGTEPGATTVVLTCAAGDPQVRDALRGRADVVDCGDDHVDLVAARDALVQRGYRRILCEGGPTVFGDLLRAGVVDELCLSISPILGGPGPGRITAGDAFPGDPAQLRLVGLLTEDDALFCRYAVSPVAARGE